MSLNIISSSLRAKPGQSKRIEHPAFEDSDSEDDTGITKAMQFQSLLRQDAQLRESNADPLSGTVPPESAPRVASHTRLLHAIPSSFRLLKFRHQTRPYFLMVNESSTNPSLVPPLLPPPTRPLPPQPMSPPSLTSFVPIASDVQAPTPAFGLLPTSISPPHRRTRRHTLLLAPHYADATSRPKESLLLRKHRSFDFGELLNTKVEGREPPLREREQQEPQEFAFIPPSNHASSSSPWARSTNSIQPILVQDRPQSMPFSGADDSHATPSSSILVGRVNPPLGLFRFEKPRLESRTVYLVPGASGKRTNPQRHQLRNAVEGHKEKFRKSSPRDLSTRDIKISAPTPLDNPTNFDESEMGPPRMAPLPPSSGALSYGAFKNTLEPLTGSTVPSEEPPKGESTHVVSQTNSHRASNEPVRRTLKFLTVAKVAGKLLRHYSQTQQTANRLPHHPLLPPLLYSASTPIEDHILAISTRIKDEFKMKLRNEIELPLVDAATEEELIQQVQDVNGDVEKCAKQIVRLLYRLSAGIRGSRSAKSTKDLDMQAEVHTELNDFLVTRVFRPFSIQLKEEDDEAVRERYERIAPSVPQFVASRWRVIASASTSRPVQELGPVLENLAADASRAILRDRSSEVDLNKQATTLLAPLLRHAYLLAHFNHLEMISADYEIFFGTDLGGWVVPSQEEEKKHSTRHSKTQDGRVSGHWSLGLRKKRYVGAGVFQRRVWDVLLRAQVLAS